MRNIQERKVGTDMRVDNAYSAYKLYNTSGSGRPRRTATFGQGPQEDTFTLSVQAEDYQLARKAISRLPDVRDQKVLQLQSQIESGQYSVSASAVADRILQNLDYIL